MRTGREGGRVLIEKMTDAVYSINVGTAIDLYGKVANF
jgi:hypothetical protein